MKVVDPGHVFDLQWLDGTPFTLEIEPEHRRIIEVRAEGGLPDFVQNRLIFVKREGDGYPGNVGHHAGTTIQETLRALISRALYLDSQIPDEQNKVLLFHLRHAILALERRAAERHGRLAAFEEYTVQGDFPYPEHLPTCPKCLHIGCHGWCHP